MSMFLVRGILVVGRWDGVFFGGVLWDTATDVSTAGETRRGREGESRGVSLGVEVAWLRDCSFDPALEDFRKLLL